jgi:hypothetical protein
MKVSKLMAFLLISALPLALACKSNEPAEVDDHSDTATQTTEQEISGTNKANDLNPVEAQTMVDDVTIGHKVAADGTIATADQGDDFAPGDPIHIVMKVGDAPANSAVKVAWYGPGEKKVDDQSKTVTAGQTYLDFAQTSTSSWPKGDYRAEIWIGDEKVNQQEFNITDAANAGK